MKAAVVTELGKPLEIRDVATPDLLPGQILVEIEASGLCHTDIHAANGDWPIKPKVPLIPGHEGVGRVVAVADDGGPHGIGDRVALPWLGYACGRCRYCVSGWETYCQSAQYTGYTVDGGFAEYVAVPAENVYPVESPLSDVELSSFPIASITAANMLYRAHVTEGETVLVTGASGGVGSAVVQLARARGAAPIAMCATEKSDAVRALGAVAVIPREPEDLRGLLRDAIGRETVDVVADVVGGRLWPRLIDALRRGGRYTCSGAIAGPIVELDLRTLYLNDLTFTGATVPPPHLFGEVVRSIETGQLEPVVAATYPLESLREAQQAFLAKAHVGNIVIDLRATR